MHAQEGLRPFGEKYLGQYGTFTYHFNLRSSDAIGLDLREVLKVIVAQPPYDFLADTALAGDTGWITNEYRRSSLVVEKLK
jgi:hypothetical protein